MLYAKCEMGKVKPKFYEFAIVLGDKHIGAVSAYLENDGKVCEIGWVLNKNYQGKGEE